MPDIGHVPAMFCANGETAELVRCLQLPSDRVRGVWQRDRLLTKHERLLRLEKATGDCKLTLSDEQIRLLERL